VRGGSAVLEDRGRRVRHLEGDQCEEGERRSK